MSALNFPASPSDGDTYLGYVYDATDGVWNANPRQLASRFITSATQPPTPQNGDGWFNTTNGKTFIYYYDGTSGQWVESGYPVLGYQSIEGLTDTSISTPTNGQVLKYDGTDWVNGVDQVGKILQVVQEIKTDANFSTSSTSLTVVTGLTASITPSSTSSKVFVSTMMPMSYNNSDGGAMAFATVFANGSNIVVPDSPGSRTVAPFAINYSNINNANTRGTWTFNFGFVHSPATTSAVTYDVRVRCNTGTLFVNRSTGDGDAESTPRGVATIILMEVAG